MKNDFYQMPTWCRRYVPLTLREGMMPWVFCALVLFLIVMLGLAVINYILFGDLAAFFVAMSCLLLIYCILQKIKLNIIIHFCILVASISIGIIIVKMGGLYSPRLAWALLIPMVAFFFLGFKFAFYWLLGIVALFFLAGFANSIDLLTPPVRIGQSYLIHNWIVLSLVCFFLFLTPLAYHIRNQSILRELNNKRQILIEQKNKLDETQALRNQFISCISHELRTPMNAIMGLNEWLTQRITEDSESHKLLRLSSQSAEHLMTVINDALDYSQLISGKIRLNLQVFDLHTCIQNTFEILAPKASSKQLKYTCTIHPGVPRWVESDRHRLVQILINLLNNAIKFTAKGCIHLEVSHDMDRVHFSVQDTGVGISEAIQPYIFERFRQDYNLNARSQDGNGLGLSIASQLVDLMCGNMDFISTPSVGTTFFFDLLLPEKPQPEMQRSHNQPKLESTKLPWVFLVVDDHPVNRFLLSRVLASNWPLAEIIEASNGIEALERIGQKSPHVVFMDMLMPVMDGTQATRAIRLLPEPFRDTIVLGLTANVNTDDLLAFNSAGLDGMMLKPFNLAQLCSDVDRLLIQRHGIS